MKKIFMVLAILLVSAVSLSAQVFDFTLINKTGYSISEVYVSPSDSDEWGDDVMGTEVLPNLKKVEITFPEDYEALLLALGVDKYDLKLVDEDGDEYEYYDLKLETINEITLTLDEDGEGLATWK